MSTPLVSIPIGVALDYSLRTVTVTLLDITITRSSVRSALDEAILKLYEHHADLQGQLDDMLSSSGSNFRDTILDFGHTHHTPLP